MAYDIVVGDEQADLATLAGWRRLKEELAENIALLPVLGGLINDGEVDDVEELLDEIDLIDAQGLSSSSQEILAGLREALKGKSGRVTLSQGFTDEDVDDDWVVEGEQYNDSDSE